MAERVEGASARRREVARALLRLRCIAERPIYEVAIAPDGDLGDLLIGQ
ncbi:MAG: hypothetical protein OXF00_13260 [bacterium]|nr:hypothetical protein [bacterium]